MSVSPGTPREDAQVAPGTTVVVLAANPESCRNCKGPLTGKQTDFCSKRCNGAWWNANYPRINREATGFRTGTLKASILELLADGQWRTEQQIADAIHGFAHSVGARLSELRRAGHPIQVERLGRLKRYRLGIQK